MDEQTPREILVMILQVTVILFLVFKPTGKDDEHEQIEEYLTKNGDE